jgi:glyoxylase-like metal-dependent hydrolase (beta-lactamase superfamily II)
LAVETEGRRRPVFSRASHVIWSVEYDFWTSEASDSLPEMLTLPPRTQLPAIREAGLLDPIDEEGEILPGVRLLFAPGHTPGPVALEVADDDESFLYLADAVLHELNFEHPLV